MSPLLPERINTVEAPVIHLLREASDQALADGIRVLNLGQAIPGYHPPFGFVEEVLAHCGGTDFTTYTADPGLPELREAIAARLSEKFAVPAEASQVIVTAGANQAYINAVLALFQPGDGMLLPSPWYFNHRMALQLAGVIPQEIPWGARGIDRAMLEEYVTPQTRGITLVTPGNPTGTVFSAEEVRIIVEFALERDLWIISDETYMELVLPGSVHLSPLTIPEARDRAVLISSFSKSLAIPGFRAGFLCLPTAVIDAVMKVQDTVIICAPNLTQRIVLAGLPTLDSFIAPQVLELDRRRKILATWCEAENVEWIEPQGALFAMLNSRCIDSFRFCLDLVRETGVVLTPGGAFGEVAEGWVRFSYGSTPRAVVTEALSRLRGRFCPQ